MLIIGHRGAKGLAPENTLAGLKAGLGNGADGLEFDVRVTKDGVPILVHDDFVVDINNKKMLVKNSTLADLKSNHQDILTLDEALAEFKNAAVLVVEIKPDVATKPVAVCINNHLDEGLEKSRLLVASFDFSILKDIERALPGVQLVVNEKWSGLRAIRRARKLKTKFITMNQRWLWSGFIKSTSHKHYKLSTYVLNDAIKARRWEKHGLYAAITDFPDRFSKGK